METEALSLFPMFSGLQPDEVARLAPLFQLVRFSAGQTIFAAGDEAARLYVLKGGEVAIRYHPYDGSSLDIATVRPQDAFGWSAALMRASYTSSAVCRTDVQALAIRARDLHRVMAEDPELGQSLLERVAQLAASRLDSLGKQAIRLFLADG